MSAIHARPVLIVGHCTIDDIIQADGRMLPGTPGGAAAYAALGAALYGARVTLVTLLGADYPLERLTSSISVGGVGGVIDIRFARRAGERSIHNIVRYADDGARAFEIESWSVMDALTPTVADLPAEIARGAPALLTPAAQSKQGDLARYLQTRECPVALDTELHYFPTPAGEAALRAAVAESTYFLPSIEHLRALYTSSASDPVVYAGTMRELGCPWVVVKQGRRGSAVIDARGGSYWRVPSIDNLAIVDTTGAGDAFGGGFVAALADGKAPVEAACWGTVAASFAVESLGISVPPHFGPDLFTARYRWLRPRVERGRLADPGKGVMLS